VIGPTGAVRVMVATKPVDFRKGAEGLAMLVRESMTSDPFSGNLTRVMNIVGIKPLLAANRA
jgi:transposase